LLMFGMIFNSWGHAAYTQAGEMLTKNLTNMTYDA